MDAFNRSGFRSIDHSGRYSYGNQPQIVQGTLPGLQNILPLIKETESAVEMAKDYRTLFGKFKEYYYPVCKKLGLLSLNRKMKT